MVLVCGGYKKPNLRIKATVPKYWPLTKDKTLVLCLCKNHLRKRAKNLGEERHLDVRTRLPQSACFELSQLSPSFKKEKWEEKLSFFFRASRMVVKQSSNIKKKYDSVKNMKICVRVIFFTFFFGFGCSDLSSVVRHPPTPMHNSAELIPNCES